MLFPHFVFFLFLLKGQPRIQSVLHFAFSLPVSLRSFHFCTERASSFFLHCILFCGWAILYLTSPQNIGVVSKLLLLQATYHGQPGPGPVLHCARVSGKLWSRGWVVTNRPPAGIYQCTLGPPGEEYPPPHNRQAHMLADGGAFANCRWKMDHFQDNFNLHFSFKELEHLSYAWAVSVLMISFSVECLNLLPYLPLRFWSFLPICRSSSYSSDMTLALYRWEELQICVW